MPVCGVADQVRVNSASTSFLKVRLLRVAIEGGTAMDMPRGIAALLAFAFGACIGSFVNVVAYRLPRGISIITPGSFCPNCGKAVPFWANIPLFAYLALRGRCIGCRAKIPFRYFLTELALASAASYLYVSFPLWDALGRYLLCTGLFIAALIDYDWRMIPNIITVPGIPLGVLAAWRVMPEVGWVSSLAGVAMGAGFLFVTGEVYLRIRGREGVGMGDVWLLGMVGAFLGWPGALFTLFAGSLLGTIGAIAMAVGGEYPRPPDPAALAESSSGEGVEGASSFLQTAIPFGPFLALAAGAFALFQPAFAEWYSR
jgi:leader peptidase (prepilin peptidase) / N-methyltransferase